MPSPPINAAGLALVKEFEGLRLSAYRCQAGIPTIGYGSTKNVKMGQRITEEQAEKLLLEDLQEAADAVSKFVVVKLTSNQRAALVSFVFNLGAGAFQKSTLRRLANLERFDEVKDEFLKWNKATVNGKKVELPGLTRRREAEAKLWGKK